MSQITIEHNPSEARLQELDVANWPIWEKEVSKFPIDFDAGIVARIKNVITIFATLLSQIHGLIGMTQQGVWVFIVMRKKCYTDAGSHLM